jgi:hypothetical protein
MSEEGAAPSRGSRTFDDTSVALGAGRLRTRDRVTPPSV